MFGSLLRSVDFHACSLHWAAIAIVLAPLIWNVVARIEYYYHPITKVTKNKYITCYIMTVWIFGFSLYRDYLYPLPH